MRLQTKVVSSILLTSRIGCTKAAVDYSERHSSNFVKLTLLPDSESAKDALDLRLDAFTALTFHLRNDGTAMALSTAALQQRQRQWLWLKQQSKILSMRLQIRRYQSCRQSRIDALKAAVDKGKAQLKL